MSQVTLESLLNKFKEEDEKKNSQGSGSKTNTDDWFPFRSMDFDQTVKLRFLPDGDPNASHFVKEKLLHKLEVSVKGKMEKRSVPCLEMFGDTCPICDTARKFYKEKDEDNGSRFWRKKSYIGQVWVLDAPFEIPGGKHKLITLESKIYEIIRKAISQGDVEHLPTDYNHGYDFRLNKTRDGKYAAYTTSSFSPRSSALPADVVAELKVYNLSEKMPRKPSLEYVDAILHAALTGEEFVWKSQEQTESDGDDSTSAKSTVAVKEKTSTTNVNATSDDVPFTGSKPVAAATNTVKEEVKQQPSSSSAKSAVADAMAIINRRKTQ